MAQDAFGRMQPKHLALIRQVNIQFSLFDMTSSMLEKVEKTMKSPSFLERAVNTEVERHLDRVAPDQR